MFASFKGWLNLKVILAGVIFALCAFGLLVGIIWSQRSKNFNPSPSTAILSVIELPTITPTLPFIAPTPTQESNIQTPEPIPGGVIKLGDYVQVTGTGGDGLRIHDTAGVASKVHYVALDNEVFIVFEGPVDADGYVWWNLKDPFSDAAIGWGVGNYLAVVPNP
jgi:hypothetical protein